MFLNFKCPCGDVALIVIASLKNAGLESAAAFVISVTFSTHLLFARKLSFARFDAMVNSYVFTDASPLKLSIFSTALI